MITFSYFLMTLLMIAGLFLIGLILLQRGRGGGLAGAFGGMGGQSAFGTKAGDVFTRITIGVATAWILLCAGNVIALHNSGDRADQSMFKKEGASAAKDKAAEAEVTKAPAKGSGDESVDLPPAAGVNNKPAGAPDAVQQKEELNKEEAAKAAEPAKADEPAKPAEPAKPEGEKAPEPPKADANPPAAEKPAEPTPDAVEKKKPE